MATDFRVDLNCVDVGETGGPGGASDLLAGAPKIDEIKVQLQIGGESTQWLIRHANLREDKKINPDPARRVAFRPSGAAAEHGGPENRYSSKNIAGYVQNQPRRPTLRPVRGFFVKPRGADVHMLDPEILPILF